MQYFLVVVVRRWGWKLFGTDKLFAGLVSKGLVLSSVFLSDSENYCALNISRTRTLALYHNQMCLEHLY